MPKYDRCKVCGKRKQIQSRSCITCFNKDKVPKDVKVWMKKYDLHRHQLRPHIIDHLRRCSPLGREITLIIMRLERDQSFSERAKALQGELHREHLAARRIRRAAELERKDELHRARILAEMMRAKPKPVERQDAVIVGQDRIARMMLLAEGRLA